MPRCYERVLIDWKDRRQLRWESLCTSVRTAYVVEETNEHDNHDGQGTWRGVSSPCYTVSSFCLRSLLSEMPTLVGFRYASPKFHCCVPLDVIEAAGAERMVLARKGPRGCNAQQSTSTALFLLGLRMCLWGEEAQWGRERFRISAKAAEPHRG